MLRPHGKATVSAVTAAWQLLKKQSVLRCSLHPLATFYGVDSDGVTRQAPQGFASIVAPDGWTEEQGPLLGAAAAAGCLVHACLCPALGPAGGPLCAGPSSRK